MNNPYSKQDLVRVVIELLAHVLGEDPERIESHTRMVDELGVESLDLVELRSLLEKRLDIRLPTRTVLEHAARLAGSARRFETAQGTLTHEGADLLARSPYAYTGLAEGTPSHQVYATTTPANLASLCHALFDHLPGTCGECGGTHALPSAAGAAACAGCGQRLRPATGDEVLAQAVAALLATTATSATTAA